ncbi:MAG: DUF898 family protein [Alphaproteobacteria bacterium]
MSLPVVPDVQPLVRQLAYDGKSSRLFVITIVNFILTLLTLGVYHFWAKTKVRRFICENTRFMDEPFAYLGNGKEIFVSSLIFVLKVILPTALIFLVVAVVAPSYAPIVGILQIAFYTGIYIYARLSGLRYRANRLSWRGIRFSLRADRNTYLKLIIKITVLNFVTLGLYRPHGDAAVANFFGNSLYYGNLRCSYHGDKADLRKNYLLYWLLWLPTLSCSMYWYRARLQRHLAKSCTLGVMDFRYNVSGGQLLRLAFGNGLIMLLSWGVLGHFVVQRNMRLFARTLKLRGTPDFAQIQKAAAEQDAAGAADYFETDGDFGFG